MFAALLLTGCGRGSSPSSAMLLLLLMVLFCSPLGVPAAQILTRCARVLVMVR